MTQPCPIPGAALRQAQGSSLHRPRLPFSLAARRLGERLAAWPEWRWLALLALGALLLRLPPWLAAYPLHRDEGLYGSWARMVVSGADPALLAAWVDKPPLVLYMLAGSIAAFGATELALRLPGMVAGLLLPLLTYGLARRTGGKRPACLAAAIVAFSPFAILFSPTAFTDPWLAAWVVGAAWAGLAGRPLPAGLFLGLAISSKQTGVLFAPLVLALLFLPRIADCVRHSLPRRAVRGAHCVSPAAGRRPNLTDHESPITNHGLRTIHQALRFALGLLLVLTPVAWWDSLRWATRPSFWTRSLDTYGDLGLAAIGQWPERAAAWAQPLGYLFGPPAVTGIILALACVGAGVSFNVETARRMNPAPDTRNPMNRIGADGTFAGMGYAVLAAYSLCYLALHFFVTFQPWDRYLLPLVPLLAIPAARGALAGWDWLSASHPRETSVSTHPGDLVNRPTTGSAAQHVGQFGKLPRDPVHALARLGHLANCPTTRALAAAAVLAGLLAWSAWLGISAGLPVGSDHGAYMGLDQVVARVRAMPWDAVVYQRSLGWQLDFYFPGYPPARIWWDDPTVLADDAEYGVKVMPEREQWLILAVVPDGDAADRARPVLQARGLALVERERVLRRDGSASFVIYQILPELSGPTSLASPPARPARSHGNRT